MEIRRVVTGHNASGQSVFVSDAAVAPVETTLMPGFAAHLLWGADKMPHFPDDGSMPEWRTYLPPIGGFRFGMITVPPETGPTPAPPDLEAALAEAEAKLPGLLSYLDPADPGMHATDSIDFEVVLEGTVVLELDDGAEVTLHPGDTVVQNGTRHRWKNPGDMPARLAVFTCGAPHSAVPPRPASR